MVYMVGDYELTFSLKGQETEDVSMYEGEITRMN